MAYIYIQNIREGEGELPLDAAMHVKARRYQQGDAFRVFDGVGGVADAKITHIDRKRVSCHISNLDKVPYEQYPTLVLGVTKLPTVEFILQKACEIGVSKIILTVCDNTPIRFDQGVYEAKQDRWQKIMISACEQSERLYIPSLEWMHFNDYIKDSDGLILHPEGEVLLKHIDQHQTVVIGPEGGFSEEEVAKQQCYRLNTGILRTDTAAMAALLLARL